MRLRKRFSCSIHLKRSGSSSSCTSTKSLGLRCVQNGSSARLRLHHSAAGPFERNPPGRGQLAVLDVCVNIREVAQVSSLKGEQNSAQAAVAALWRARAIWPAKSMSLLPLRLSRFVIGNHYKRLAGASILIVIGNMKTQRSTNSIPRLLLTVPVICSLAFAACSDVGGTARTHASVNLQSAAVGTSQTGDNVTIGPSNYNSEARSFDRPWPFGPESNPQ